MKLPKRILSGAKATVHRPMPHDSAERHVRGEALYLDDIPEPVGLLKAYVRLSERAHARIRSMDVGAAREAKGVVAVATARDLKGPNDVGPVLPGDPIFADGLVEYFGQSLFAVAAETWDDARRAAHRVNVEYEDLPAIITVEEALEQSAFVLPTEVLRRGSPEAALGRSPHRLSGRLKMGGQDHFYLEGQIAMAVPREGGDLIVYSSTQAPSEVQHLVARALGKAQHTVSVEVRRLGGAFGGKETQATLIAAIAALLAAKTGRPVKLRLDRDDDMLLTGKRHDFVVDYDVGYDETGRIQALTMVLASRCGMSPDLSGAVNDRAMLHADNAYFLPHVAITSHRCKTNTVSNTAFRGFGGPQGMMAIEWVVDEVARALGKDSLLVRKRNLYGPRRRAKTPYGMKVDEKVLPDLVRELEASAQYAARRREIEAFNAASRFAKRGLSLTPVKFGISFTATHMNQAGALLHVYADGSVQLSHGGIEMGQGLYVKVAQVVADELGLGLDSIRLMPTTTEKVPNTSPTAASSGSDLNGKAAEAAARAVKARMARVAARHLGGKASRAQFRGGWVFVGDRGMEFREVAALAHEERVSLSSTGFYRTPLVHWDRKTFRGRPFYYFSYGAAVAEVEIDLFTGEYRVRRVDILHDCGGSLNPAVDRGQVEGGFVQGMGWLTAEELWWDRAGRLMTHAPSTYKVPSVSDVPEDFRVTLRLRTANRLPTVRRSKAVGEPPLMLAISVFHALKDAVAAAGGYRVSPRLDAPATPERVLLAVEDVRRRLGADEPRRAP